MPKNEKQKISAEDMIVDLIPEDDEVITLFDEENKPVNFYQIACVQHNEDIYVMLQPAEEMEGIEDDEVAVLKVLPGEGEEDNFEPVTDEQLLDEIFKAYIKAEEEYAEEGDGCGCGHDHGDDDDDDEDGCDGCGCGCGHDHE